ncbi:MAG: glycosyl hydrolase [Bacteroidetes bacterium]|nr:glycosyl hydrolase [Bacteroidota bacterium]
MKRIFTSVLGVIICFHSFAQKQKPESVNTFRADTYKGLKWRNIGPGRGGRANAIAGHPLNRNIYYVGYTGGGVWMTENGGLSWKNISDGFFKVGSIGEIAVSPSDPNVIYVGTGEHAVRGVMTSFGDGIYKSTDGGKTWKKTGLEKSRHISDIAIHPNNPDILWVAAQGPVHGASADRGIYKSVDGGQTWKKTLYIDENTGASSLSMDITNPRVLYAAMWQHRRSPWKVESGPNSSIWKSVDGGETWEKIMEGLPQEMGKIGISVSRANPGKVYAIIEAEKSKAGLYRSDDGGKKWTQQSNDQNITSRSWYYMEVFADPQNENTVYVLNAPAMKSIDGGKTFHNVPIAHGDTHDYWINPNDNTNQAIADDGGAEISFDNGKSWSNLNNQPTAQFYRVNVDNRFPYWVYGGQQDNTSVMIASRTNGMGITDKDWLIGPGCESAWIAFDDPNHPNLIYGGCYQGLIDVLDLRTNELKNIQEYPSTNLAYAPKDMKYRFNWNAPLINSPHDPKTLYHAGNVLFKSVDGGIRWDVISPDLTRNDTTKQNYSGGPITNEGAGGENYNTIYYVIESPLEKGVIYTGSDCGLVYLTKDDGRTWNNITPLGLPEGMIHSIEVSPHDKATVYISASRYKFNDFNNMVYKSTDYGKTWTKLNTGIDADDFIKVVREDKVVKNLLYAGSERGFYISYNGGLNWNKMQLNLPVVPVTDLIIHDNDLIAATAGRAFWILDDLAPFQQSKGEFAGLKIYEPKPTVRLTSFAPSWMEVPPGTGQNPTNGVEFTYYLKEKPDTNRITLEIFDTDKKLIRQYTNKKDENLKPGNLPPPSLLPSEAGLNRFGWDYRTEALPDLPGTYIYGDMSGYRVAPGRYKALIKYKNETSETDFELIADPRLNVRPEDWKTQQLILSQMDEAVKEMHQSIKNMNKVKKQIEDYNELLKNEPNAKELIQSGKEIIKKISKWESSLLETRSKNFQDAINFRNRLNAEYLQVRSAADTHDPRLTQGVKDRLNDVQADWGKSKKELQSILINDVSNYNKMFKEKNVPAIITELKEIIINN